jgi:hypothetical protein
MVIGMQPEEPVKKIIAEYQCKMSDLNAKRNKILSDFRRVLDATVVEKLAHILTHNHGGS